MISMRPDQVVYLRLAAAVRQQSAATAVASVASVAAAAVVLRGGDGGERGRSVRRLLQHTHVHLHELTVLNRWHLVISRDEGEDRQWEDGEDRGEGRMARRGRENAVVVGEAECERNERDMGIRGAVCIGQG